MARNVSIVESRISRLFQDSVSTTRVNFEIQHGAGIERSYLCTEVFAVSSSLFLLLQYLRNPYRLWAWRLLRYRCEDEGWVAGYRQGKAIVGTEKSEGVRLRKKSE